MRFQYPMQADHTKKEKKLGLKMHSEQSIALFIINLKKISIKDNFYEK
jgi:hypothetical protein